MNRLIKRIWELRASFFHTAGWHGHGRNASISASPSKPRRLHDGLHRLCWVTAPSNFRIFTPSAVQQFPCFVGQEFPVGFVHQLQLFRQSVRSLFFAASHVEAASAARIPMYCRVRFDMILLRCAQSGGSGYHAAFASASNREACLPKEFSSLLRPFRCLHSPILNTPMGKVPLRHVSIALVVDVVKCSVVWDKVGGIVVNVQSSRV